MNYLFSKHLILRKPVKNPADWELPTQNFLDDPAFRSAIYLASETFFKAIALRNFSAENLSEKESITVQKYINRYCYRPTPFGLFSSVSLANWEMESKTKKLAPQALAVYVEPSQAYQAILAGDLLSNELNVEINYEGNPSIYRVGSEYRFLSTGLDKNFRHREYLLQSVDFSKVLKDLNAYCRLGRSRSEIISYVMTAAVCNREEGKEYAEFLIDAQFLVSRERANITGPVYLNRLLEDLKPGERTKRALELSHAMDKISSAKSINDVFFERLHGELNKLLPVNRAAYDTEQPSVILCDREGSGLNIKYRESLREGIYALNILSPAIQLPAITAFKASFQKHFEGQAIPLLQALDPETGIGYEHPLEYYHNPLLETLNIAYQKQPQAGSTWTEIHRLLMQCWLNASAAKTTAVIRLERSDFEKLELSVDLATVSGFSVLFRVAENKVIIESAGGINAPALLGRFTVADESFSVAAKEMAAHLEQLNPDVLFAELLHLSDPHVDNINRRESIYRYEFPLTAKSVLPPEFQISLSDLFVNIEDGLIFLYSKKHNKRVIPRLTSAYNHNQNKLPLFRFLADLAYQYGRHNLGFDLQQYFPGLSFYPRVEYQDNILNLATWVLSGEQLKVLDSPDENIVVAAFLKMSEELKLTLMFSLTEGDQQLVFDRRKSTDILFFRACVRNKEMAILREFPYQPEIRQYNAYALPSTPLNFPKSSCTRPGRVTMRGKRQRKFVPGSEWLFLKIYPPGNGANELLLRLRPLLGKRYSHGKIKKWFFIRYEDHAPHIRLRMQVFPEDISDILLAFKAKLNDRIQQHVIREYQIDVYTREVERYGAAGIEKTEDFFWASSEIILSYLSHNQHNRTVFPHHFALYSTNAIVNTFIPDRDEQLAFLLQSYEQFLPEFAGGKVKAEMDKKYRELSQGIQATMNIVDPALRSGSVKAGKNFLRQLTSLQQNARAGYEEQLQYLRSIIHMHLNRLFKDEPRKQEMLIYYLLFKYKLSLKAREKL